MAWDHLSINKPHLAYTILGGFTSIFMLCSLFIKEKLYIGEATVATICGIIFGPKGVGLFVPNSWGNVDQITLEASRIVLVVQCFAVGVELPKKYMTRHWKSVVFLLLPVMTWGWLITSVFIWWIIPSLSWLESLTCAACVTATDPVLASSVVGKGKFAKRIPKHLRDLLSAESGCNDGMAFPFIYLSLYLIKYKPHAAEVFQHWFCLTVLYECLFGAIYGTMIGYAGRHAIKFAERKNLIDRESFLVFYFVLALWCAGTGSMLGLDDLLVGFCAGVAFSNDGWFTQQTEESHVSNVIDLLLNLAFFVYFGSIIPWDSFNRPDWDITPWRLIVISIFVILFRRIPIMLALKPVIPDIKTWREALFAGHFGPIGVGAIFVAILARAELETGDTTPLAVMPPPGSVNYLIIELIWPITTFLIMASILVHGSSIAVFTLGKRINTMRITMSFTTANEEPSWMARLPRLTPRASMSMRKVDLEGESSDEKSMTLPPGTLPPPGGIPGGFLSRRPAADDEKQETPIPSRPGSIRTKRRKNWESGHGPGGPIHDSAIAPRRALTDQLPNTGDLELGPRNEAQTPTEGYQTPTGIAAYQEGEDIIIENAQGDVIAKSKAPGAEHHHHHNPVADFAHHVAYPHDKTPQSPGEVKDEQSAMLAAAAEISNHPGSLKHHERKPAWAYRLDDNITVEDEDGEVIRRYKLPKEKRPDTGAHRSSVPWMSGLLPKLKRRVSHQQSTAEDAEDNDNDDAKTVYSMKAEDDDDRHRPERGVHFRMHDERGRRLSKHQFLQQLQRMGPHARAAIASTDPSDDALTERLRHQTGAKDNRGLPEVPAAPAADEETAAEKRRREAALGIVDNEGDSDEEGQGGRLEGPSSSSVGKKRTLLHPRGGGGSSQPPPPPPPPPQRAPGIRFAEDVGRETPQHHD